VSERASSDRPRALTRRFKSDAVRVLREARGEPRYVLADDPAREISYRSPYILELELTRRCNLRCVHCYARAEDRSFTEELSLPEIDRLLDQGREAGIGDLSLTGGEALLHPDFFAVLDGALSRGYETRFVTNATLVDERMLRELCQRPIKLVTVSLDAVTPEVHERIRGPGSHGPALRGIERLLDAGFPLSIITAFSRLNVEDFDALLAFCVAHRVDWQVQMTSAKGRCPGSIVFSPEEYYAFGERVAAALASQPPITIVPMDDLNTCSLFSPLSNLSRFWQGRCLGGLLNLFVRANGDVTPCSALAFPDFVVGNVRRDSLAAICAEERCRHSLAWLRPDALTGLCASCAKKERCSGGCPEILLSMCRARTENEYCYRHVEQRRILEEVLGDA